MPRTYTRSQLRTRALRYADHENDTFGATAELDEMIDVAYARLWELLVEARLGYFASTTSSETTMSGTSATIALAADFGYLLAVEYKLDGEHFLNVPRIQEREVADHTVSADLAYGYKLDGANITLVPRPANGKVYRYRYIAAPAKLAADTTTVDGISGWEDYIPLDVALKIKIKEEADVRPLMALRQEILDRIEKARDNLVLLEPAHTRNLDADRYADPFYYDSGAPRGGSWMTRRW